MAERASAIPPPSAKKNCSEGAARLARKDTVATKASPVAEGKCEGRASCLAGESTIPPLWRRTNRGRESGADGSPTRPEESRRDRQGQGHRLRQSEGRRGEDHHHAQPGGGLR